MKRILYSLLFFFAFSFCIFCASSVPSSAKSLSEYSYKTIDGFDFYFVDSELVLPCDFDSQYNINLSDKLSIASSSGRLFDSCIFSYFQDTSHPVITSYPSISGVSTNSTDFSFSSGSLFGITTPSSSLSFYLNNYSTNDYSSSSRTFNVNSSDFICFLVYTSSFLSINGVNFSPRDPFSYDEFLSYDYKRHNLNLSSPYVVYFGNLLRNNHLEPHFLDYTMSVVLPFPKYVTWMHDTIVDYYGGNVSLTLDDVHGYFQSQGRPDSWADLKYDYDNSLDFIFTHQIFGEAFDSTSPPEGNYGFGIGYSLADLGLSESVDALITFYLSFPYRVSVYQGSDYFGTCEWYPSYSSSLTTQGRFPLKPFQPISPRPEDSSAISMPSTDLSVDGYFDNASDLFNFSNPSALAFFVSLILLVPTSLITFAFVRLICLLAVKFLRLLLGL